MDLTTYRTAVKEAFREYESTLDDAWNILQDRLHASRDKHINASEETIADEPQSYPQVEGKLK